MINIFHFKQFSELFLKLYDKLQFRYHYLKINILDK